MKKNNTYSLFNIFHKVNRICGFVIILFLSFAGSLSAQNQSPEILRQKMAKIRQTTDWNNPVAAKKANDEIKILSKQLMMSGKNQNPVNHNDSATQGNNEIKPKATVENELQQEMDAYSTKLSNQMMKIAREGDESKMDLAEPLREEIAEEYKEDENPTVKNLDYLREITLLYIDMSSPTIRYVINQMENYKSIQTLVITGGKNGAVVNLENLLAKAAHYPLEQLYIINFKGFVTKVPQSICNFRQLKYLALYNNKISQLPPEISTIVQLKSLYIEMNPMVAILPLIKTLNNLDTLGIAKTQITDDEIKRIKQQLPNCKIIQQ